MYLDNNDTNNNNQEIDFRIVVVKYFRKYSNTNKDNDILQSLSLFVFIKALRTTISLIYSITRGCGFEIFFWMHITEWRLKDFK